MENWRPKAKQNVIAILLWRLENIGTGPLGQMGGKVIDCRLNTVVYSP